MPVYLPAVPLYQQLIPTCVICGMLTVDIWLCFNTYLLSSMEYIACHHKRLLYERLPVIDTVMFPANKI